MYLAYKGNDLHRIFTFLLPFVHIKITTYSLSIGMCASKHSFILHLCIILQLISLLSFHLPFWCHAVDVNLKNCINCFILIKINWRISNRDTHNTNFHYMNSYQFSLYLLLIFYISCFICNKYINYISHRTTHTTTEKWNDDDNDETNNDKFIGWGKEELGYTHAHSWCSTFPTIFAGNC